MIGRPPPPEEDDPFFARALPAEAVPADSSGRIGSSREPTEVAPEPVVEAPVDEGPVEKDPVEEPVIPPEHADEGRTACFSCVRICAVDHRGHASCGEDNDDLICGWGSHRDVEEARRSASAHCDATLDMARQMPTYSEITGSCPRATCQ